MIESAEEFKVLRESKNPEEYLRAATDEADLSVWKDILSRYPDMAFWVAQNKTVPIKILEILSEGYDSKVRGMVARKRKLPEHLMLKLANDSDSSVRYAVANNSKATLQVLELLSKDSWSPVQECAKLKMKTLTSSKTAAHCVRSDGARTRRPF